LYLCLQLVLPSAHLCVLMATGRRLRFTDQPVAFPLFVLMTLLCGVLALLEVRSWLVMDGGRTVQVQVERRLNPNPR
jgi:hypothetical protein